MSLITWKDEFNIGIPSVDFEHRELIGLINELHDTMCRGTDSDRVALGLGEIFARISGHFALEESLMREAGYEFFAEHKQDHELLLDELRDLMEQVELAGDFDHALLSRDLDRWFSEHFRTHDAKLHRRFGH